MSLMKTEVLGLFVTALVSVGLWFGLYWTLLALANMTAESVMKTVAGVFLLVGSWLVIRACAELDRG